MQRRLGGAIKNNTKKEGSDGRNDDDVASRIRSKFLQRKFSFSNNDHGDDFEVQKQWVPHAIMIIVLKKIN